MSRARGFDPATRPGVEFPGCLGEGARTKYRDSVIDWAGQSPCAALTIRSAAFVVSGAPGPPTHTHSLLN